MLFQREQTFVHAGGEVRRAYVRAQVTDPEEIPGQPCVREPVSLWEKRHNHEDAERDQQGALQQSKDASSEPVEAAQTYAVQRL